MPNQANKRVKMKRMAIKQRRSSKKEKRWSTNVE
jgi:hypothetical protein